MGDSSQSSYQLVIAGFQPQTHSLVQAVFVISKYVWKPSSCPGLQNAPCVDIMRGETVYVGEISVNPPYLQASIHLQHDNFSHFPGGKTKKKGHLAANREIHNPAFYHLVM